MDKPDDTHYSETQEFSVIIADHEDPHKALDAVMAEKGYVRISGDNEDTPGVLAATGWRDLDGDGEVD